MPDALKTIFDHIPKTGGTSVRAAIEQAVGEQSAVLNISTPHHIIVASAGSRRVICGHLWFYAGELLVSGWFYATLLRDPLDRFLSLYHFYRQYRQQVLEGSMIDPAEAAAVFHDDLESFLSDRRTDVTRSYSNFQAMHFAARMCERPDELNEAQLLDAAITSLKDYDLVGVYTEIDTFFSRYCDAIGVPRRGLPKMNVTQERRLVSEIPQHVRCKLITANSIDSALIDWVRHDHSRRRAPARRATAAGMTNFGTREIEIRAVEFLGARGARAVFLYSERVRIRLKCHSRICEDNFTVGIAVYSDVGHEVLAVKSKTLEAVPSNSDLIVRVEFNAYFPDGDYQIVLALAGGINRLHRCFHWVSGATRFRVEFEQTSSGDLGPGVTFAIEGICDNTNSDDPS
jgi:hypothetical protein